MAKTTKDENALDKDRQELFCQEYIISLNATQAALRAGYSENTARTQGSFLLTKVDILTRVGELMKERADRLKIDAGFVLEGLIEVYQKCMQLTPVMVWDSELKMKVPATNENGGGIFEFDSLGALKALEMIGKHLKMFTDKTEVTGADGKELIINIVKKGGA